MSESGEKRDSVSSADGGQDPTIVQRPTGLKGLYYNPYTQVCMLGFVCFMCPGKVDPIGLTRDDNPPS